MCSAPGYVAPLLAPALRLHEEIDGFLADREARGLSDGTLRHYGQKLATLQVYLRDVGIRSLREVTPWHIRGFLQHLARTHNPGGVHAFYRSAKALLRWYEQEEGPEGWVNPIDKVHAPKVPQQLLDPVDPDLIRQMVQQCVGRSLTDRRDRAVLMFLLDSGCRASELTALNVEDLDLASGAVTVRHGKGGKARVVFAGKKARRALGTYLRARGAVEGDEPLFASAPGTRLRYEALRDIVRRRAAQAGVPAPTLHSFRRGFALESLRQGMDAFSVQRLLGHSDLTMTRRYIAQNTDDIRQAHARCSPVDHLL